MNRIGATSAAILLLTCCLSADSGTHNGTLPMSLKFCDFEVPAELMRGNFSSLIIYEFRVTEDGRPEGLSKRLDDFVGLEEVKACLSSWDLRGLETDADYKVVFSWRHGKGWERMSILGPGINLVVEQSGNPAPYQAATKPTPSGADSPEP